MGNNAFLTRRIPTLILTFSLLLARPVFAGDRAGEEVINVERHFIGHADGVRAVCFFPDGKRFASASHDRSVRIWDVATGRTLRTITGHAGSVESLDISPDGKLIATGSTDKSARVWDAQTGDQIGQFEGHTDTVTGVLFLPGNRLLTGGHEGVLRVWDLQTEKEIWRTEESDCVMSIAASNDGNWAAYGDCSGITHLFDIQHQRDAGKFGKPQRGSGSIWFSPDNKTFYATGWGFNAWDVATGKPHPVPKTSLFGKFSVSADGLYAIYANGTVLRFDTGKQACKLMSGSEACFTLSPDHRRALVGAGGRYQNGQWLPSPPNEISSFALPDFSQASPEVPGPPSGAISWDFLDAKIHQLDGTTVSFADKTYNDFPGFASDSGREWRTLAVTVPDPAGPRPIDLIIGQGVVLMQRQPGLLEEILADTHGGYGSAIFDGKHFFLTSTSKGIIVLDLQGAVVAIIGEAQGLPKAKEAMDVRLISSGKLFVAGCDNAWKKGDGWCAIVEEAKAGFAVNVFFRDAEFAATPDAWKPDPTFRPVYITEPPASNEGQRAFWVVCERCERSPAPILRFDLTTLKASTFNLLPPAANPRGSGAAPQADTLGYGHLGRPLWLNDHEVLVTDEYNAYAVRTDRGPFIDARTRELLAAAVYTDVRRIDYQQPLHIGGQAYLPGPEWYRIDLKTREAVDLGPGLRADGKLIGDKITYFVSAHFGLMAISSIDKAIFRISVDPNKPARFRAYRDTPAQPAAPLLDSVTYGREGVTFKRGLGDLTFHDGQLIIPTQLIGGHTSHAAAQLDPYHRRNLWLLRAKFGQLASDTERKRVGITPDQWKNALAISAALAKPPQALQTSQPRHSATPPFDRPHLEQLYKAYEAAPEGDAKDKAAEPLFAQAKLFGDSWSQELNALDASAADVFTPAQWDLILYHRPK